MPSLRSVVPSPEELDHRAAHSLAEQARAQMERLVESVHFRSSRRYPALLRFIVEEALAGRSDALKERTIGVEVFGRTPDYDTNLDPVVRVTAGKIRQRLTQYYAEPEHAGELRIHLHQGSYIPHFEDGLSGASPTTDSAPAGLDREDDSLPTPLLVLAGAAEPARAGAGLTDAEASHAVLTDLELHELLARPMEPVADAAGATAEPATDPPLPGSGPETRIWPQRFGVALCLVALGVGLLWAWHRHAVMAAENNFWAPLLGSEQPLLFVLGVHSLDENGKDAPVEHLSPPHSQAPGDSMLTDMTRSEMVSISDAIAYSNLASLISRRHHGVRTLAAVATSMEQVRQGPVALVGGFNNAWTLRLTSGLRFHFVSKSEAVHAIADREHPATEWLVDTAQSALHTPRDYAIVARFLDPELDQPVLVAAGIGKSGTEAAAEFLTTKSYLQSWLAGLPEAAGRNVEIVLATDLIEGQHGAPHVVASATW